MGRDTAPLYSVSQWTARSLKRELPMLIGGKWIGSRSGRTFETINPATKEVLSTVAWGDEGDVDRAVDAARTAIESKAWRLMTAAERSNLLLRLADLIERYADDLAVLESLDNGKPSKIARAVEVEGSIKTLRYFAGWPTKFGGETIPVSPRDRSSILNYTLKQPVGVCGLITPWNYPLSMAVWKVAPAVAAGCTVVLKPAEQTPLTALRLGELVLEAGFPEGVVNIVTGKGDTGAALVAHKGVDKIAFTGSTEVGKKIVQASVGNLKRVSLELGGKSPNIVLPDADLAKAAKSAASGIFSNQGQTCTAGSRLYVHEDVHDVFVGLLVQEARALKIGPGLDPISDLGPVISQEQLDRILSYIEIGHREGARLACGGGRPAHLDAGYFLEPTVFLGAQQSMRVVQEEIFGPVASVLTWRNHDDLVRNANDSVYGLGAGVWTNDLANAHHLAHALKAGTVWVNCYNLVDAASPFGGYKESGWGREMGRYAMDLYSETKSIWINLSH